MSFFKTFFEWWKNKESQENNTPHRFDDLFLDAQSSNPDLSGPTYTHKSPAQSHRHEDIIKSSEEFLDKNPSGGHDEQNLKEALHIAQSAHFLSDDQRASSILSLIGEEEALLAIRALRWRQGLYCPFCGSQRIKRVKNSKTLLEKYICESCQEGGHSGEFDDLTNYFDDYEMNSVRLWILIAYLRTFLPMSKVAKVLGMSLEQAVRLIDLMTPKDQSTLAKKARRSDSYFS